MRALFLVAVIALFSLACAQPDEFAVAKQLVESKTGCDTLSDAQLELIGDYLMEQLHPGEAHERMDAMMGGEGSESLKRIHINMGINFYCGGNTRYGMVGGGMMGYNSYNTNNNFGYINWIFMILTFLILALIVILVLKKSNKKMKNK